MSDFLARMTVLAVLLALAPLPAAAWGVCVDWHPSAPRCDDDGSTGRSRTWVPAPPVKTPRDFAREAYARCVAEYKAGKLEAALKSCRQSTGHDSSYAPAYNLIAGIYNTWKDYDRAVTAIRDAIARENTEDYRKNLVLILENWASAALRNKDYRLAESLARSILGQEFDNGDAHYVLGRIRELNGDLDGALDYYDRSRPKDARRIRDILAARARAEADRRLRQTLSEWRRAASEALTRNRFADAMAYFGRLLDQRPRDINAWHGMAKALAGLGRLSEAEAAYRRAGMLGAGEDWAENAVFALYWNDADRRAKGSDENGAHAIWRDLIERYPGKRGNFARWRMINLLGDANRHRDMAPLALDILRADPGNPHATRLLAQIRSQLARTAAREAEADGDSERAMANLKGLLRDNPDAVNAAGDLVFHLIRQGRKDEALELARATVERQPNQANAQIALAAAYRALNQQDLAVRHAEKANELSGGHFADYVQETGGALGTTMTVIGTVLKPVTAIYDGVGRTWQRGKTVAADWAVAMGDLLTPERSSAESLDAARAARFYGSLAVMAGPEGARSLSSLVFDNGAMMPPGSAVDGVAAVSSVAVEGGLPPIEMPAPESVRNSPSWQDAARRKRALDAERDTLRTRIDQLKTQYDRTPKATERQNVAVEIATLKQKESEVVSQANTETVRMSEMARVGFHFDTTVVKTGNDKAAPSQETPSAQGQP